MTVLDQFLLDQDVAIVTGGSRGIGNEIAHALAEAGAAVVIANRTEAEAAAEEIRRETGSDALWVGTDITDDADVEQLVARTVDEFGGIDVLVNNAGVSVKSPAFEKTVSEFRRTLEINLVGTFQCTKHVGKEMKSGGGGSIINISSMSAYVANYPQGLVDYQASKGGLEAFKNQLASEWAEHDIRVNNINPGYVDTDILLDDEEMRRIWRSEMLQEEFADPSEIAPLAVYLASEASSYVTGESILIDGGYTVR